jgi:F-type H+-transporting ATPase subunit epsilon
MRNLLSIKIISPSGKILEDSEFDSITIPTSEGEITLLPGHVPLVAKVAPGEIVARKKDNEESIVTTDGFLKLNKKGQVLVLSDYAVRSEDVEIAKVEEAKKRAESLLKEKANEKDFVIAEAELRKTLLELKIAQKRKSRIR